MRQQEAAPERESFANAEICLIVVSFGLLVLTCVEAQPVRNLVVLAWLTSFTMLAVWNIGAALGLYVSAVALYSNLHFGGTFSVFERPDHPALLILLGSLAVLRFGGFRYSFNLMALAIIAFLSYGTVNGFLNGTVSGATIAEFARRLGIPMVLLLLITNAGSRRKDLWSFFSVMLLLAFYSSVVAVMWQIDGFREFIFPRWLTDPEVSKWATSTRSGGILIQPGWNGLMLAMIFCMAYLAYHRWIFGPGRILLLIVGGLSLVGIYFGFSRAAYLSAMAAGLGLFWMKTGKDRNLAARRLALSLVAVVGLAVAFVVRPSTLESRVSTEETAVWRLEIWTIALNMIPERPLFGFGFRGYGDNAYKYLDDSVDLSRGALEENTPAVHNTFLNIMVELGLVGFALYALALFLIILRASRRAHERWGRQGVIWVLVFGAVYYIKGQFGVTQEPTTNAIFFGTLGMIAGLPMLRKNHEFSMVDRNHGSQAELDGRVGLGRIPPLSPGAQKLGRRTRNYFRTLVSVPPEGVAMSPGNSVSSSWFMKFTTVGCSALFLACTGNGEDLSLTSTHQTEAPSLEIAPKGMSLSVGESLRFIFTLQGTQELPSQVAWEASGGLIDETGLFVAGAQTGLYEVRAEIELEQLVLTDVATGFVLPPDELLPEPDTLESRLLEDDPSALLQDGFEDNNFGRWSGLAPAGDPFWDGVGDGGAHLGDGYITTERVYAGERAWKAMIDPSKSSSGKVNKASLENWWSTRGVTDFYISAWYFIPTDYPSVSSQIMQIKAAGGPNSHEPVGIRIRRDRELIIRSGILERTVYKTGVRVPLGRWFQLTGRFVISEWGLVELWLDGQSIASVHTDTRHSVGAYPGVGNYVDDSDYPVTCHIYIDNVRITTAPPD